MTLFTLMSPTIPEPICSRARIPYSQRKADQQIDKVHAVCFKIQSESATWRVATALLYTDALQNPCLYHPLEEENTSLSRSQLGLLLHKLSETQHNEQDAEAILDLWSALSKHLSTIKASEVGNRLLTRVVDLVIRDKMDSDMWQTLAQNMLKHDSPTSLKRALLRAEAGLAIEHPKLSLNLPICIGLQLRRAAVCATGDLTPPHLINSDTAEASDLINARLNYHGALGYQNGWSGAPYGQVGADLWLRQSAQQKMNKAIAEQLAALDPSVVEAWQSASYAEQNAVATQLSAIFAEAVHHKKLPYLFIDGIAKHSASSAVHSLRTESLQEDMATFAEANYTIKDHVHAYRQWLFPCLDVNSNQIELTAEARCIWYTLCGICNIHIPKNAEPWIQQFKEGLQLLKHCIHLQALQEESVKIEPDIFNDLVGLCHLYSMEQTTEAQCYLAKCTQSVTEHSSSSTPDHYYPDDFFETPQGDSDLELTQHPYNISSSLGL